MTLKEVKVLLQPKKLDIRNFINPNAPYTINSDGSYDITGDVSMVFTLQLKEIPFKFNKVTGNFSCHYNKLTSLKNAPKEIGGDFNCQYNRITSLEGCPKYVGGNFTISHNSKQFTVDEIKQICDVKGNINV